MTDATEALFAALDLALREERGRLIVALYELPEADLERLVEAVQLIDAEGVEALDFYDRESRTQEALDRASLSRSGAEVRVMDE